MNVTTVVARGVVWPNGTLALDGNPELPVGPVEVVIKALSTAQSTSEDWWQYLQRSRNELEASGSKFMNLEEVNAHIEWLREGDRTDEALNGGNLL